MARNKLGIISLVYFWYDIGKTIGNGTFGKVHLGLHIPTGERVAAKIIDKQKLNTKELILIQR
jgi:serine/threonine protein kinase